MIQRRAKLCGLGARKVSPQFRQRMARRIMSLANMLKPRESAGWQGT